MNKINLLGILTFFLVMSCNQKTENDAHKKYNNLLQSAVEKGFPGFILAVQTGSEPIWIGASGLSSIEEKKAMLENDRFHIASITKLFTSIIILQLIDEEKIDFDSPVTSFLNPKLIKGIPYIEQISINQLLDHSSGIYSFNNDLDYINTILGSQALDSINWTNEKLVQLANENRVNPLGKPGTGHYYSDVNQILMAEVASYITKKPFRQLVFERIINPLQLKNTGFYNNNPRKEKFEINITSQGYLKRSKALDDFISIHPSFKEVLVDSIKLVNTTSAVEHIDASSGIVSTVEDLAILGQELYKGNLVSKKSLNWLLSIGNNIHMEKVNTKRQGITTVRIKSYGVLYTSLGDGGGGMNTMLAYHPESKTIVVAYANIFGNFDEHDFFIDVIIPKVLLSSKKKSIEN